MRKYFLNLCLILSTFLLIGATTAVKQQWFSVKWISDGDTIVLDDGRHVRYIGINAPEIAHDNHKAEPFGYEAKKYNQSLLRSQKVRLEFDKEKHDRYGRLLAYIFLSDGIFINKKMKKVIKALLIAIMLSVFAGCCALPDAPGPIGIPLC